MINSQNILDIFKQKFGSPALLVSAPGRANIIGEHTDYNDGLVLPFAVNKRIYFAASPNGKEYFNIYSTNLNKDLTLYPSQNWNKGFAKYYSNVCQSFTRNSHSFGGMDIVFGGDLPIGAGMSSSSAVTCGFIALLNQQFNIGLSQSQMVSLALEAEQGAGVQGGAMDQSTIMHGKLDHAILLDCQSGHRDLVKIDLGEYMFCLFNTNVEHNLENTEYNTRSATCREAIKIISSHEKDVESYRQVNERHLQFLNPLQKKRVRHVIHENNRVIKTVDALRESDLHQVGSLINESHQSLRDLFEVSCGELDFLQEKLIKSGDVLGARMMGGGFGGCVIALLKKDSLKDISLSLAEEYLKEFELDLDVYPIKPEEGLAVKKLNIV